MNVYELNKMAYKDVPAMEQGAIFEVISDYVADNPSQYYMMLNHDIHYFTLFNLIHEDLRAAASEITDIAIELGKVVDVVNNDDHSMLEIWIRQDDEVRMYGLFDYQKGVVEV